MAAANQAPAAPWSGLEEEEAAAVVAALGGWRAVNRPPIVVRDFPEVPAEDPNFDANDGLRNVFSSMGVTANRVWARRRRATANDVVSFRRETNAVRADFRTFRGSALYYREVVLEAGGVPYPMPAGLEEAVAELELPPHVLAGFPVAA